MAAVILLAVEALIAWTGIRRSAWLTVALSAVQVAGLLLIIVIAVPHVGSHSLTAGTTTAGVMSGAALAFFAFIGFDEVITLAEETRRPARVVPRALLTALGLSTLLYVAVAIAAVSVIGAESLAASSRPLGDVMGAALGRSAEGMVAVIALVSTMNTSLLALTAGSRDLSHTRAKEAHLGESWPIHHARRPAPPASCP